MVGAGGGALQATNRRGMTHLFKVEPSARELASITAGAGARRNNAGKTTAENPACAFDGNPGRWPAVICCGNPGAGWPALYRAARTTTGHHPSPGRASDRRPATTLEQGRLLRLFQREWQAFITFAGEIIRQRQAVDWNIALHRLAAETDPMANRTIALATTMAADAKIRLEQEADAARAASAITVWNLAIMILVMLAVAWHVEKARPDLTLPIAALPRRPETGDGGLAIT